jgi:hypothetical protein
MYSRLGANTSCGFVVLSGSAQTKFHVADQARPPAPSQIMYGNENIFHGYRTERVIIWQRHQQYCRCRKQWRPSGYQIRIFDNAVDCELIWAMTSACFSKKISFGLSANKEIHSKPLLRSRKLRLTTVRTRCANHVTPLYPQKLALTWLRCGGRSVGRYSSLAD